MRLEKLEDKTGTSSALVCLHVARLEADDSGDPELQLNSVPVSHDWMLFSLNSSSVKHWHLTDL